MSLARTNPEQFNAVMDEFAAEERATEARSRAIVESTGRSTRGGPDLFASVRRTNSPEQMGLDGFSESVRDALAKAALWFAAEERDARTVEPVIGPRAFRSEEVQAQARIRRSVFLGEVTEALRVQRERDAEDAREQAEAF